MNVYVGTHTFVILRLLCIDSQYMLLSSAYVITFLAKCKTMSSFYLFFVLHQV